MEGLKSFKDNEFDLAIVDPPYGIDADRKNSGSNSETHKRTSLAKINTYKTGWDSNIPNEKYFNELFKVEILGPILVFLSVSKYFLFLYFSWYNYFSTLFFVSKFS